MLACRLLLLLLIAPAAHAVEPACIDRDLAVGIKFGKPLSADVLVTYKNMQNGKETIDSMRMKIARDGQARISIRRPVSWESGSSPATSDAVFWASTVCDIRARAMLSFVPHLWGRPENGAAHPHGKYVMTEDGGEAIVDSSWRPHPLVLEPPEVGGRIVTKLGIKEIDGISAQGVLIVEADDTNSYESWFSEELRCIVLSISKHKDRETTMRLMNIRYAEPDPALFRIPDGYNVTRRP